MTAALPSRALLLVAADFGLGGLLYARVAASLGVLLVVLGLLLVAGLAYELSTADDGAAGGMA